MNWIFIFILLFLLYFCFKVFFALSRPQYVLSPRLLFPSIVIEVIAIIVSSNFVSSGSLFLGFFSFDKTFYSLAISSFYIIDYFVLLFIARRGVNKAIALTKSYLISVINGNISLSFESYMHSLREYNVEFYYKLALRKYQYYFRDEISSLLH